ncbi:hypothetical protein ACFFS2_35825 [Streptomyces aurantiacus]|uniref:hypothetical protein n=1 Tax=Streptomyces aurantiacus TaxID=47760 RepID=UPI001FE62F9D|nr:hypothetical protein [Streptomyces aurantiacus]
MGRFPLKNIRAADLRAYIAKLASTVSSVDYQRGILSELPSILEAAVDERCDQPAQPNSRRPRSGVRSASG